MLIFVAISLANINLMNVAYGKKTIADVDQPVLPPWGGHVVRAKHSLRSCRLQ